MSKTMNPNGPNSKTEENLNFEIIFYMDTHIHEHAYLKLSLKYV